MRHARTCETIYLAARRIISPLFDTQIAAACAGLKPQVGYAELVRMLLDVNLPKGQTRTDWSKRPLSAAQLRLRRRCVAYLGEIANAAGRRAAQTRARALGDRGLRGARGSAAYEPDPAQAWERCAGLAQLAPRPRALAKAIAVWRGRKRARAICRARGSFRIRRYSTLGTRPIRRRPRAARAARPPATTGGRGARLGDCSPPAIAQRAVTDSEPGQESRARRRNRKSRLELGRHRRCRAADLGISAEVLAPRGELKALAMGRRDTHAPARLEARGDRRRRWLNCRRAEGFRQALHGARRSARKRSACRRRRLRCAADPRPVVLDQRPGLRLVDLEALADDLLPVVGALQQARHVVACRIAAASRAAR